MRTYEGSAVVSATAIWVDRNVGEDWLVLDLRDREAFDYQHLPGAMHVPLAELGEHEVRIKVYGAGRHIACVLPAGADPDPVRMGLSEMGIDQVAILQGGVRAWSELGFPLVSSVEVTDPDTRAPFLAGGLIVGGLIMGAFVSPGFLIVSGLGWAVCGARTGRVAAAAAPAAAPAGGLAVH